MDFARGLFVFALVARQLRRKGSPIYFRNHGHGQFAVKDLPNVNHPAYAMTWGDLNRDGELDLVMAAYDVDRSEPLTDATFASGGTEWQYDSTPKDVVVGNPTLSRVTSRSASPALPRS